MNGEQRGMAFLSTFVAIVVLISGIAFLASPGLAHRDESDVRTVNARGTATLSLDPDMATIILGVETYGKTAEAAENENSRIINNVISALEKLGLDEEDIETYRYDIYPYKEDEKPIYPVREKEPVVKSVSSEIQKIKAISSYNKPMVAQADEDLVKEVVKYRVIHMLKIETDDLDLVSKIIDRAVSNGTNRVDSVTFGLDEETVEEKKLELLELAAEKAKVKAKVIASALGETILRLRQASEEGLYYQPYIYSGLKAETASSVQIVPGEIEISATVFASFELV